MARIRVTPVSRFNTRIYARIKIDIEEARDTLKKAGFIVVKQKTRGISRGQPYSVVADAQDVAAALEGRPHRSPLKGQALADYVHEQLRLAEKTRMAWGYDDLSVETRHFAREAELPVEIARRELKKLEKKKLAIGMTSRNKVPSRAGGSIVRSVTFWSLR